MNTRKTVLATLLAALAAAPLAVTPVPVQAQAHPQPQATHFYTQAELDQMLAPIALYPDALLSQVLMAATYPIEVVEAARWSRANPGLQGDDAVRAVQHEDWDPSVKSLVAFPQILQRMDEKLEWTRALGDAFLAQEPQMMDQVQRLRQRAEANGNLRSDEQIRVVHEGPVIVVRPARPEYVYVPYYDPMEVYGTWWWPDYRPVYWAPWPGYARPRPSYAFWWGRPTGLSIGFFFGDFDWGRRHVRVAHNSYYYRQPAYFARAYSGDRTRWQHDPQHRRAVAYRNNEVRQRFATAQLERREAVREERRDDRQLERRTVTPAPRAERRDDRRDDRQAGRQAQPAATVQAQPQAVTPAQRAERREDRRDERRAERQAAPAATPAQPAAQPRSERREDRREERRAERQAAPTATPTQPAAQPRAEQRDDRRAERQAAMQAQRQAQLQAQQQQAQAAQRQAQLQAQQQQAQAAQRQAQQAQRQAQQQARQPQPAATMPAAQAPQTPRAERQERREDRREQRKDRDKG